MSAPPSRTSSLLSDPLPDRGSLASQPKTPVFAVPASPRPGSARSVRIDIAIGRLVDDDDERKRAPEVATEALQDA